MQEKDDNKQEIIVKGLAYAKRKKLGLIFWMTMISVYEIY